MASKKKEGAAMKEVRKVTKAVKGEIEKGRVQVEKEMAKMKKHLDGTYTKVEKFVKKNPEQAAMVSAAVGVTLGAALMKLLGGKPKGKK